MYLLTRISHTSSLKGGYVFLGKRDDIKYKGGFAEAVELGVSHDT